MRTGWLTACGVGLLLAGSLRAQTPGDRPTDLPPLLAVPPANPAPPPPTPVGPPANYDHGYLYLPETAPPGPKLPPCPCRPLGRWWINPSLELGWSQPVRLPAMVRLGVLDRFGGAMAGQTVFGDEPFPAPFRAGVALSAGFWFDQCQTRGVDASFYFLGEAGNETAIAPTARTTLLMPATTPTGEPALFPLAGPGVGVGAFQAGVWTRFASADVNYRRTLYCETNVRLDGLVGYRYAHLGEDLSLYGKRLGADGGIVRFTDHADAANNFHGGQLGLAGELRREGWYLGFTGKVALGAVVTDTNLDGKFRVNGTVEPYGYYARPAVAGPRDCTRFGVMPTVGINLGRQFGEHGRVFVGYNFQYLSNVIRPGDVIDPTPDVFGPGTLMRRDATTGDFWVQSVSLGLEWRY